jgi:hypothetical protein
MGMPIFRLYRLFRTWQNVAIKKIVRKNAMSLRSYANLSNRARSDGFAINFEGGGSYLKKLQEATIVTNL